MEKQTIKKSLVNIFIPMTKVELKAKHFYEKWNDELYGKGQFNLSLYRKVLKAKGY